MIVPFINYAIINNKICNIYVTKFFLCTKKEMILDDFLSLIAPSKVT